MAKIQSLFISPKTPIQLKSLCWVTELEDTVLAIRLENYTGPVTEDMFILA